MSFEQKRNAERLPLDEPIDGVASGTAVKIVEMSAIGCRIEHKDKLSIGGSTSLRFTWRGQTIELRGKIARTQLKSAYPQGMYFETGLKFADSVEAAPPELRNLLASIVEPQIPPEVEKKVSTAEVPAIPEPPPTPGEDTLRRIRLKTERESKLSLDAFAPVEPPPPDDFSMDDAPDTGYVNPFVSQKEAVALAMAPAEPAIEEIEMSEEVAPEPEPEPEVDYIECRLVNGTWARSVVHTLMQPDEGFITLPADDQELQMLCKTYADPETRRLIRISLELAAARR